MINTNEQTRENKAEEFCPYQGLRDTFTKGYIEMALESGKSMADIRNARENIALGLSFMSAFGGGIAAPSDPAGDARDQDPYDCNTVPAGRQLPHNKYLRLLEMCSRGCSDEDARSLCYIRDEEFRREREISS